MQALFLFGFGREPLLGRHATGLAPLVGSGQQQLGSPLPARQGRGLGVQPNVRITPLTGGIVCQLLQFSQPGLTLCLQAPQYRYHQTVDRSQQRATRYIGVIVLTETPGPVTAPAQQCHQQLTQGFPVVVEMQQQFAQVITGRGVAAQGLKELGDRPLEQGLILFGHLNGAPHPAQYWHLTDQVSAKPIDRTDVKLFGFQGPALRFGMPQCGQGQRPGLLLVGLLDGHLSAGFVQFGHQPPPHFRRRFAGEGNGQYLFRTIHRGQQRKNTLGQ